jgi:integrase
MTMPKKVERALSPMKVKTAGPGMHCDGGGLYLQVTEMKGGGLTRSWIFRYRVGKRLRDMGLGPLSTLGLAEARERARQQRVKRLDGVDPIEERRSARATPAVKLVTFDEAAAAYIAANEATWKNTRHAEQWRKTLNAYASPVIGGLPVGEIDTKHVTRILDKPWQDTPETASRVRGRIEAVLDWAKVRGHRGGENPARWRGHLDHIYPALSAAKKAKRTRVGRDGHHAAMPYDEVAAFLSELRQRTGNAARALEFAILTAARTGEALGAKWDEINVGAAVWTVPASRMKGGQEHRVPLSSRAVEIIKEVAGLRQSEYVFCGDREGEPLSNMALLMALRRMGRSDVTVHGFRSSFRDWAGEQTNFPREIAEAALAHVIENKAEAAYRRGDALEKRRKLMEAWAQYVGRSVTESSPVVTLRAL